MIRFDFASRHQNKKNKRGSVGRAYKSQETCVKVGAHTLLRRDLVSSRVLDNLVKTRVAGRVRIISLLSRSSRELYL